MTGQRDKQKTDSTCLSPFACLVTFLAMTSAFIQMKEGFLTGTQSLLLALGGKGKLMVCDMSWTWQNAQQG